MNFSFWLELPRCLWSWEITIQFMSFTFDHPEETYLKSFESECGCLVDSPQCIVKQKSTQDYSSTIMIQIIAGVRGKINIFYSNQCMSSLPQLHAMCLGKESLSFNLYNHPNHLHGRGPPLKMTWKAENQQSPNLKFNCFQYYSASTSKQVHRFLVCAKSSS